MNASLSAWRRYIKNRAQDSAIVARFISRRRRQTFTFWMTKTTTSKERNATEASSASRSRCFYLESLSKMLRKLVLAWRKEIRKQKLLRSKCDKALAGRRLSGVRGCWRLCRQKCSTNKRLRQREVLAVSRWRARILGLRWYQWRAWVDEAAQPRDHPHCLMNGAKRRALLQRSSSTQDVSSRSSCDFP